MVFWKKHKIGRIDREPKAYPNDVHVPWRWFLDDPTRDRMASGPAGDLEQAMVLFRRAFEQVPDNTVEKAA